MEIPVREKYARENEQELLIQNAAQPRGPLLPQAVAPPRIPRFYEPMCGTRTLLAKAASSLDESYVAE
jgi:hypothetical protein